MRIIATELAEVLLLEPKVHADERGHLFESFHAGRFRELIGLDVDFVQENQSYSRKHVLRGLHFQRSPKAQGKLVRVLAGAVFDVAVDIRPDSKSFGRWTGALLSAENRRQMWIPAGFAHGFLTLSETSTLLYKASDYYAPEHEGSIAWDDPALQIAWPISAPPILSAKDSGAPRLETAALQAP